MRLRLLLGSATFGLALGIGMLLLPYSEGGVDCGSVLFGSDCSQRATRFLIAVAAFVLGAASAWNARRILKR
ncbi:MAG: hypothetical protein OEX04_11465 [Acidimicrobiia bacterium]|nr:hypothetical protein [Acidimicrobiia bacterium]MDH4308085.1 hypothetical protein [Acidimicrobiia bacterium]MDH5293087.1 hypothetical protein [Acidimicrobiia bacterium]